MDSQVVFMMCPVLGRRKRSYKQAMSEPDEEQPEDEELQPPQNKTPSPPCPANKVCRFFPLLGACPTCSVLTLALVCRWYGPSGPSCTQCRRTKCS